MFYNPVRIFGILGLIGVLVAGLVAVGLVIARLMGITTLGMWGVAAVYTALVAGVIGVSVFALGAAFNYLVSLFYKTPIRQGLFGRPILKTPIETYFGWAGLVLATLGTVAAIVSLCWVFRVGKLHVYGCICLGSAMLTLVGMQLLINWFLMRILGEFSKRSEFVEQDINPVL